MWLRPHKGERIPHSRRRAGGRGEASLRLLLILGIAPVGRALTGLLSLLDGSLCLTRGDELEVEVAALQVEPCAQLVVHVHALDVVGGEGLHGRLGGRVLGGGYRLGTLAGDAGGEASQVAQLDGVALGDGLLDVRGIMVCGCSTFCFYVDALTDMRSFGAPARDVVAACPLHKVRQTTVLDMLLNDLQIIKIDGLTIASEETNS